MSTQEPSSSQSTTQNVAMVVDSQTTNEQTQLNPAEEDEKTKKDRALVDFMLMLDEFEPLIPNEVTEYYLQKVGFQCDDARVKRLLSLATQKFVSDIASDAFQHARLRTNAATVSRSKSGKDAQQSTAKDKTRTVLTMDDLSSALSEYGMTAKKPEYYL